MIFVISVLKMQMIDVVNMVFVVYISLDVRVHSHITSAFAFFFDLCHPVLENTNVKC